MAATYPWRWLRGTSPTQKTKFTIGAGNLGIAWSPVTLTSNLVVVPTNGCELLGVVPSNALASETGVIVYTGNDVYEVQLNTAVHVHMGDPVEINSDGTVDPVTSGYAVGYVVDYNPAVAGIAHIMARASVLSTSGIDDAALKLPLGGGTMTGDLVMTGGEHITLGEASNIAAGTTTGTKIGTGATQKLGFWNATPVVQQNHIADALAAYTTGDLDAESEIIAAVNAHGVKINAILSLLETLGLVKSA